MDNDLDLEDFDPSEGVLQEGECPASNVLQAQDEKPTSGRGVLFGKAVPLLQWSTIGSRRYAPCGKTVRNLPAAIYMIGHNNQGIYFEEVDFPTDDLLRFPDGPTDLVIDRTERFWLSETRYKEHGLLHKTGILLWGPSGCGKSSVIKLISQDLISRGGIVLVTENPHVMPLALNIVRDIEKERPIINIIEDIDDKMSSPEKASTLLSLLDGEHQTSNVLHIATTNYPERLEERIVQRPGRFDLIVQMDLPSAVARKMYLKHFLSKAYSEQVLDRWVADTHGFGVAHIRDLVASVECLGLDYKESLTRLKLNKKKAPKRSQHDNGFGFNPKLGEGK